MEKNKFKYILTGLVLITLFIYACTTEKNTSLTRTYHNITAKYNVYFNARESYNRGITRIYSQQENYSELLPIFPESLESSAGMASGDMDRTINKASKAIKIHSITVKPERKSSGPMSDKEKAFFDKNEYCKWIDDSYLLMGKAYLVKRDFSQARQNFEFIIRQYPEEDTRHHAYLLLARTFIEQKNYVNAKEVLDLIDADREFPEKLKKDFAIIYADYFIQQKQYADAVQKLKFATDNIKRQKHKVRYLYILAQLHERLGNLKTASDFYAQAARRNPNYEMEFNAKINMAKCFMGEGQDLRDIQKLLSRMLRDEKNLEYRDQIYFAIAEIDFRLNKIEDAIENYKKSSAVSSFNDFQKAQSCLRLGQIFFDRQDYKQSQIYYDTCMMFLPYSYANYREIKKNADNLSELVRHINIVEFQDSVQKIALMSDAERNRLIDGIIAEIVEKERLERELERQQQINSMLFDERRGHHQGARPPSSGKWYLYDPAQLSFGQNEFRKKFGTRRNEDHWRRRNKAIVDDFDLLGDGDIHPDSVGGGQKLSNEKSREYYLQDIPLNDSLLSISHNKILESLYQIGRLYKDNFTNYYLSINTYEELNSRYPNNHYLLLTYYNLYLLSKLTNQEQKAQTYKDLLVAKFPDTHYANLLRNPNYLIELEQKRKRDEQVYIETYDAFVYGRCNTVNQNAERYIKENPEGELVARFEYLKTLCTGKTSDTTQFKHALVSFMQKYPADDLYMAAQNILNYFGTSDIESLIADLKSRPPVEQGSDEQKYEKTEEGLQSTKLEFAFNELENHYYVIKIKSDKIDEKRLSFEVRNFNIFTFSMRTFTVTTSVYDSNHQFVVVRTFNNSRQVVNYRNMIANNNDVFGRLNANDYEVFVISESNYNILTKQANIKDYLVFYKQFYR